MKSFILEMNSISALVICLISMPHLVFMNDHVSRRHRRDLYFYNRQQNILFERGHASPFESMESTGFGKYDFESEISIDKDVRLSDIKFQENQEILQRISYLKTRCICRLFCTG